MGEEAGHYHSLHATEVVMLTRDSEESELPTESPLAPFGASMRKKMSECDCRGTETHPADAMDRSVDGSLPFDACQSTSTDNGINDWILGHAPLDNNSFRDFSTACPLNMPLF